MLNEFSKYIFAGIVNTAITLISILLLTYIGCNIYIANGFGYALGIIASFIINSCLTFESEISFRKGTKFLIVCLMSYCINITVIKCILKYLDPGGIYMAQVLGCMFYTITGFVLNKYWTFK